MEKYYEILDSKYWTLQNQRPWQPKTVWQSQKVVWKAPENSRNTSQIFRAIALISLGLLFWRLADHQTGGNGVTLNLIGLILALAAFFAIKLDQRKIFRG